MIRSALRQPLTPVASNPLTSSGSSANTAANPLRYVMAGASSVGTAEYTLGSTYTRFASRVIGTVGSGDLTELAVILRGFILSQTDTLSTSNNVTYQAWVKATGKTAVQVTWSGVSSRTVTPGELRVTSDAITPLALGFSGGVIPRGTRIVVSVDAQAGNGFKVPKHLSLTTQSGQFFGVPYNNATCTITNFATGESGFTWSGTGLTSVVMTVPTEIVGKFSGGDKRSVVLIGDSIVEGVSPTSTESFGGGSYSGRSLFATDLVTTSAIAGCNAGCSSGQAQAWNTGATSLARLADISSLANTMIEEYGINSLSYSGGQSLADTIFARSKVIWDAFKAASGATAGLTPIIIRPSLLSKTNAAGTTPQAGCALGETLDLLCQKLAAQASVEGYTYVNLRTAGAMLSNDPTNADNYKWNTTYSTDGLHPNEAGHALFAAPVRAIIQGL
jgi:lysophospholipase L1-like esterase